MQNVRAKECGREVGSVPCRRAPFCPDGAPDLRVARPGEAVLRSLCSRTSRLHAVFLPGCRASAGAQAQAQAACPEARPSSVRALALASALAFAFALALALAFAFAVTPRQALAEEYSMPQVDIDATVGADGSLHVVEERTFAFSGGYSAAWFSLDLPYNGSLRVNGVWMGDPDDIDMNGNVISTPLKRVSFDLDWREGGGPGVSSYAVDMPRDTVYVFFNSSDEECTITLDYTVENALGVYRDVGELYWSYLSSSWDVDSQNVTLTVHLPVPAGTQVTPGDTVRAWGHGPQDGAVAINADGSVTCTCPLVRAGQYAAVRAVFPTSWLSDVPLKIRQKHQTEARLETVLKEEAAWTDTASAQHESWLTFKSGVAGVSALLLAAAAVLWACLGRERRADWHGEPGPDVLDASVHPAVAGRLWRSDRDSARDMTATVIRLAHAGVIGLERCTVENADGAERAQCTLVRKASAENGGRQQPDQPADDDSLDAGIVRLLFDRLAEGADRLTFDAIPRVADERPNDFLAWTNAWQAQLSENVREACLFDARSATMQLPVTGVGLAWAALGLAAWYFFHDATYAWLMVPCGVVVAAFGANMPRKTQAGADLAARCEALRAWVLAEKRQRRGDAPAQGVSCGEEFVKSDAAVPEKGAVERSGGVLQDAAATCAASAESVPGKSLYRKRLAPYAYVLQADTTETADALTAAFDEGWHAAREALRAKVRARHRGVR